MHKFFAALLAALFCFSTAPALASTGGLIRGTVDVQNRPTGGVKMTLSGEGSLLQTTTDASGRYVFSQVPFGTYKLSANYPGVPERQLTVAVTSDSVLDINFALGKLKTIAVARVTSSAGAAGTPVNVNVIGRRQLGALPTNNSLDRVIETVPGVIRFSYNEPIANGFHGLTYYIDGAPMPQATTSNFSQILDPKSIDSLEVYTGDYPAEYGGTRMGAVVNIITNRASDLTKPSAGSLTGGIGSYGQTLASLNEAVKVGAGDLFFNFNTQRTLRGIDTPTYNPIHDNSSTDDEFLRYVTPLNALDSLAFDFSNQLAQFQIPINTSIGNVATIDPQVSPPGTDDVQNEYDRFANLNFTASSKDGNGVFQFIPWVRYARVAYLGDLANDVQQTLYPGPDPSLTPTYLAGLREDQRASYVGFDASQFRATKHHAFKVGIDMDREAYTNDQSIAAPAATSPPASALPYVAAASFTGQAGTNTGIYAEDKWSPSQALTVDYGVRYDHSTGFTEGSQISPRLAVNIAPDARNVVHFYYGRMYAAPLLEDERSACVVALGCRLTNIPYDLKPERDSFFEMGVSHTFSPTINGYVNYFRRTAVNILDTTNLLNTPIFAVYNNAIGEDDGFEGRLRGDIPNGDSWFISATVSQALAGDISGGLFLFCPPESVSIPSCASQGAFEPNPGAPFTAEDLQPEDHDQTIAQEGAYTHRFGTAKAFFATLEDDYGTGFPVNFQNGIARLPTHLSFDLALGKDAGKGAGGPHSLGFDLDVTNLLNHQYVVKIANGFNTTQIVSGRSVLLRVTAPF
jgi:outer membrane receptor protein involved in Fe transport